MNKYKVGDTLRVKKGCENFCRTYKKTTGAHKIKITSISNSGNYWYDIQSDSGEILNNCINCFNEEDLEPITKDISRIEDYEVGDILVNGHGDRMVLAVIGRVIVLSVYGDFDIANDGISTVTELACFGYKFKTNTPPVQEFTKQQIAEKLGIPVEEFKII
jgi:hypothetical protein